MSRKKKTKNKKGHWILDNPLARRSLKGTVERDTVKGSLWRPVKREKKRTIISHNQKVEHYICKARKNGDLGELKVY